MSSSGAERGICRVVLWGSPTSNHLHTIEHAASALRCVVAPDAHANEALPALKAMDRLEQYAVRSGHHTIRLEAAVKELPPGVDGWTDYEPERGSIVVKLAVPTYDALEKDAPWARFRFGCEVGHAVLHADELIHTGLLTKQMEALMPFRRIEPTYTRSLDAEAEATAFSEALLVPLEGLNTMNQALIPVLMEEKQVAALFKVSIETARRRLKSFSLHKVRSIHPSAAIFR